MKKIGVLALVLVFAFGALGIGYAHWSQTLYIDGTVKTGTLGVGFWECVCTELPEVGDKEVGSIVCEMVDQKGEKFEPYPEPGSMKPVYETIVVTIDNAYPCYGVHIVHTVVNFGTIPAHVISYDLSDPTGELKFLWTTPPPASPAYGLFWKDFNGNGSYDPPDPAVDDPGELIISVKLVNLVCEQLDPCSEEKGELDLHVEQAAEQDHTYNFLATIEAVQWNAP